MKDTEKFPSDFSLFVISASFKCIFHFHPWKPGAKYVCVSYSMCIGSIYVISAAAELHCLLAVDVKGKVIVPQDNSIY